MTDTTLYYTQDYALLIGICIMGMIMHQKNSYALQLQIWLYTYFIWLHMLDTTIYTAIKTLFMNNIHDYELQTQEYA